VLIHGFTQSARSWGAIGAALAARHAVIAVDAPGHGQSAGVVADLPAGADLMAATAGGDASWLGYSMGGRYALHVALRHPGVVRRLVLVSATGGIDDPAERAARREADEALAVKAEAEGVAAFVAWWLQRPLFATLPRDAAAVESRLGGTSAGLASSLRLAGTGTQQPLWSQLPELGMPVLVVTGELDAAYRAHGRRLVESIGPNASLAVIEGAGHACHLEAPDAFLAAVAPFLDGH
jgi:2-succinyl-6-hydroxy-2,4-cyclohexadiene-1-carboxylate synthase